VFDWFGEPASWRPIGRHARALTIQRTRLEWSWPFLVKAARADTCTHGRTALAGCVFIREFFFDEDESG
jgi:hypothetical protein